MKTEIEPADREAANKRRSNPTPDMNCKYGAPMGRPERNQDCVGKVSLRRIPLDGGGYDSGGAYWGLGAALYWAGDESGALDIFFRATSREAAKAHVTGLWPDATFYR